ncbi:hypothetical protein FQA39_LY17949 [Lamprigera yunnana]|nr:hypothetical protein FQA39_LY17949 [Lamprigera yunnana]
MKTTVPETALFTIEQQPNFYSEVKDDRLISEAIINPEEGSICNSDEDKLPPNNKSIFEELHANTSSMENTTVNTLKTVPKVTNIQKAANFNPSILILIDTEKDIKTLKEKTMEILRKTMQIQIQHNEIDFISRLRERKQDISRPVKIEITTIMKKWEIMQNTKKLAGTKIRVKDLDKKTREVQKQLIPHMINARKRAIIKKDRLIINGEE